MGQPNISHITDRLYISDAAAAYDAATLRKYNIRHILSILHHGPPIDVINNYITEHIHYLRFQLCDAPDAPISEVFPDMIRFIEQSLEGEGNVLVHCGEGRSRSTTAVAAYLLHSCPTTFRSVDEVFEYIRSKRPATNPNAGFRAQLETFLQDLRSTAKGKIKVA